MNATPCTSFAHVTTASYTGRAASENRSDARGSPCQTTGRVCIQPFTISRRPTIVSPAALIMMLSTSCGSKPLFSGPVDAVPTSLSASTDPLSAPPTPSFCAQRAATPATCGVAMLVPLSDSSPPPVFAD